MKAQAKGNFTWQCCTGTVPQDVAEYANLIYYYNDRGIFISQYMPSVLEYEHKGKKLTLECNTRFPDEGRIIYHVKTDKPISLDIHFRVPSWATGENRIRVNGAAQDVILVQKLGSSWVPGMMGIPSKWSFPIPCISALSISIIRKLWH